MRTTTPSETTRDLTHPKDEPAPEKIVDAINGVFGPQRKGARAVHAKGIVLEGTFASTSLARRLSRAPHLRENATVPITVRFSNFAGVPTVSDLDALASPRGLAIRFHLPDGTSTDMVTHSFNGFPTKTVGEFRELFIALGTSGKDVPHPTPAETFLASHPIAKAFLTAPNPPPVSYASLPYFGVNSFSFTNEHGEETIGRYRLEPAMGEQLLTEAQRTSVGTEYLREELTTRIAREPIVFRLMFQLATATDVVDDPSIAWPDSRESVQLGTLTVRAIVEHEAEVARTLMFDPSALPDGIRAADPMVAARGAAYPVSLSRRNL